MENRVKIGDMLYCKYRGWVEVTEVVDGGFYVRHNYTEYFQKNEDIGVILSNNIKPRGVESNSFSSGQKIYNEFVPINYKECVYNIKLLEKDSVLKEEAVYLSKVRNSIGYKVYNMQNKINSLDLDTRWTFSPTQEEREEWVLNRDAKQRELKEIYNLKQSELEPYFARMDMKSQLDKNIINVYIGKSAISQKGENLVYDWRSPLGQRYYRRNELDFSIGDEKYKINLIRRFEIRMSQLYSYENEYCRNKKLKDSNSQANSNNISDPFLIKVLKNKRNKENIENIVSSIQVNQNNIITQDLNANIIVQGCAGSGKTMVLLHRLSYLLYNNRNLELDRVKIITPNKIFKMSINSLAQDLELDKINITSIEEYMHDKSKEYGVKFKYEFYQEDIPNEMYNYIYSTEFLLELTHYYNSYIESLWNKFRGYHIDKLVQNYEVEIDKRECNGGFNHLNRLVEKTIFQFNKKYNDYTEMVNKENKFVKEIQLKINTEKETIVQLEELILLFNSEKNLGWLDIREKMKIKSSIRKLENKLKLNGNHSLNYQDITCIIDEKNNLINSYEEIIKLQPINKDNEAMKEFRKYNFLDKEPEEVMRMLNELSVLLKEEKTFLETRVFNPLILNISNRYRYRGNINGRVKAFILLNLLYMHYGKLVKTDKMLCFDEGQDINKLEYKLINNINGGNVVYNILGDVNQLISKDRGIYDWELLNEEKKFIKFNLSENYRNSQAVTEYCINTTGYKMTSIGIDDGEIIFNEGDENSLKDIIIQFTRFKAKRKAIIVKEINASLEEDFQSYFKQSSINIIRNESIQVQSGKINVISIDLVKGMEFDATLVLTRNMTNNEKYIALTRSLINCYVVNK